MGKEERGITWGTLVVMQPSLKGSPSNVSEVYFEADMLLSEGWKSYAGSWEYEIH